MESWEVWTFPSAVCSAYLLVHRWFNVAIYLRRCAPCFINNIAYNNECSLRRVPHRQNAAGSYHECRDAASARIRRCVGKSKFGCAVSFNSLLPRSTAVTKVAYIDTEGTFISTCVHVSGVSNIFHVGTFRPDRIRSIADRFGVDGNMALENILYGKS